MRRFVMAPAMAALVLAAAGCGSSDKKSDGGAKPLTKAEFISRADAICKAGDDKIVAAARGLGSNPNAAQIKTFATSVVIPYIENQLTEIKALTPPDSDKAQIQKLETELADGISKLKADPSQITSKTADPFHAANADAKAYGLKVCGQNS